MDTDRYPWTFGVYITFNSKNGDEGFAVLGEILLEGLIALLFW